MLVCVQAFQVVLIFSALVHVNGFLSRNMMPRVHTSLLKPLQQRQETCLHGIPKLFRWLVDLYPLVVESVGKGLTEKALSVDNFYLDMNGIIHSCTHSNSDTLVLSSEKDMFIRIFAYTDRLYKLVRPRRRMFLAVDGVAPRAKMNQQRSRRFRSSKERETLLSDYVAREGELPDTESFDSNCITPGTEFMYRLGIAFERWIEHKMKTDPVWQNGAEIIFSGPDVPGEGEHKVMDMIREEQAADPNYQHGQWRHCMYGLDADLIMLSLVTHEPFFVLLRENARVRRMNKDAMSYEPEDFELLEVSVLRKMLQTHFKSLTSDPAQQQQQQRQQQQQNRATMKKLKEAEWAYAMGPHALPEQTISNHPNGLSLENSVELEGEEPDDATSEAMAVEGAVEGAKKRPSINRLIDDFVFMCFLIGNDFLPNIPHLDIADGSLNMMMDVYRDLFSTSSQLQGHLTQQEALHLPRIELFIQEVARREPLYFQHRAVEDKDPGYQGANYKDHYYKVKFGLEPDDIAGRRRIVEAYIEGLAWVSRYYHQGCGSWTWYYPYLYAPLASDLVALADIPLQFAQGRPFTPLLQLLSVLPPQSSGFLPTAYADLMVNPLSPLQPYYPTDFLVDANGKRNSWESVVLIPFLNESVLLEQVSTINHSQNLTELERLRNRLGRAHHYLPPKRTQPPPLINADGRSDHVWGNVLASDTKNTRSNYYNNKNNNNRYNSNNKYDTVTTSKPSKSWTSSASTASSSNSYTKGISTSNSHSESSSKGNGKGYRSASSPSKYGSFSKRGDGLDRIDRF